MGKPRIAYLVPGHFLLPSAGPTRNVLSLSRELAQHADVTVAFRRTLEAPDSPPFEVLELDPDTPASPGSDDAAIRGRGVGDLATYVRRLRQFCRTHRFDLVLEKSWIFSGMLASDVRSRGIPGVVVENVVRQWSPTGRGETPGALRPWFSAGTWSGWMKHALSQRLVARGLAGSDLVIAETLELKRGLLERFALPDEKVQVVGLGVDHQRFRPSAPSDVAAARRELGLGEPTTMALYTGVLDPTHDLIPLLRALGSLRDRELELHVVGDGECRGAFEEEARRAGARAIFHGRAPHDRIPRFLAAADLCVAPYDVAAFPGGRVAYSTLKIPEAMACGTPVASVPEGRPGELIRDGCSGFLVSNRTEAWERCLRELPSRDGLAAMGREAVADAAPLTWARTAERYMELCAGLLREVPHGA